MNELVKVFQFEDKPLTVVMYKGRPAFIGKEVEERLGYTNGKLSELARNEWAEEIVYGDDFVVVVGEELAGLKRLLRQTTEYGVSRARGMMLLFETGVHALALLSRKPEARRFRRFLSSEVMPQLVRDGRFLPDRKVTEAGELVGRETGLATLSVKERVMLMDAEIRSRAEGRKQYEAETKRIEAEAKKLRCEVMEKNVIARLAAEDRRMVMETNRGKQDDFRRREQESKAIMAAADARLEMGQIDRNGYNAHKLKAAEVITGARIGTWATGESGKKFITPTELAKKLNTTPHHIGELVSEVSKIWGVDVRNDRRYTMPRLHRIAVKSNGDDIHADGYCIGELLAGVITSLRRKELGKGFSGIQTDLVL